MHLLANHNYTIGWICALPLEMAAARAMLDDDHGRPNCQDPSDPNNYYCGSIGGHNVVIACLPNGVYGTSSAAFVAARMLSSFKSVRTGLMVGIGGGVPSKEVDIRLGDVVVSKPGKSSGGVIQYDFGKTTGEGQFEITASLNKPPQILLTAISSLEADHMLGENSISKLISATLTRHPEMQNEFVYQGAENDKLFDKDYEHPNDQSTNCDLCDATKMKKRPFRNKPHIYYGLIASANQVMKHAITRDKLREQLDVLCFEMEAAGLMDNFPCLVIRGICDYSDSHKNKRWQKYAAATAAAYAKELLQIIPLDPISNNSSGLNQHSSQEPTSNSITMESQQSSTFIFTSTPYAREDIPLAGLVPDKRYPHQDVFSVLEVEEGKDFSVRIDKLFNQKISGESKSFFRRTIMNIFSASADGKTKNSIQVSSAEGRIYELRQPKALFDMLCTWEEVQKWLEDTYISGEDVYFIVGYRTLINGILGLQEPRSASFSKSLNIETLGERIYAICYRKIGFKFLKGASTAFLKPGNRWKPFFSSRGSDVDVDQIIEAGIEDEEDEEENSISETFETDGENETFVCLSMEDD